MINYDDEKVIKFFSGSNNKKSFKNFLNISGILIYIDEIVSDLNENENSIPDSVKICTFLWIYLNMYELILDTFTSSLLNYYKSKKDKVKGYKKIKEKIDKGEHLMTGSIENELIELNILTESNNSILSHKGSRLFRNKLGHANLFYDNEAKKLILTNGEEYSIDEFKKEFEKIYQFILEWLFQLNDQNSDIHKTTRKIISRISRDLSRDFIQIERGGFRKDFANLILDIKTKG